MKILYSCLSKSWGGMEMVTVTSIRQLLERDVNVELICTAESRIHIEANNTGAIIYPVKAPGYIHPIATIRTASIIKNGKYDITHTHASKDLWLLVPALKLLRSKVPLILTKHVGSFIKKTDRMHTWLYNRLDYALAISSVIKKNLLETTALSDEKITLHYNGVDTKKFDPQKVDRTIIRDEFNVKENEILIGMIARFSEGKGHEEFLSAANELNKYYNHLKFIIVGEASRGEDNYEKKIKSLAQEYNLKNLIFSGFRSDIPQILNSMDIFAFPSHSEAFGVALIEAMAMEKPSVCTNSDGILDICIDNETGFLFEKQNSKDLADKIKLLIDSKELRSQFGKAARQRVLERFDSELLIDELIKFYKEIIKHN